MDRLKIHIIPKNPLYTRAYKTQESISYIIIF